MERGLSQLERIQVTDMKKLRVLSFNAEDWYNGFIPSDDKNWNRFEYRVDKLTYPVLDLLDEKSIKATFFCLGWLADNHPDIIKEIYKRGHSIGCNGYWHVSPNSMTKDEFYIETKSAKDSIENLIGSTVKYYRAPNFAIDGCEDWYFDMLSELDFKADSSAYGNQPYKVNDLTEFPIEKVGPISFIGGGYFRLLPYNLIKKIADNKNYMMSYFHPRDFDINQPRWPELSAKDRFLNYVGVKTALNKFNKFISDFDFIDLDTALKSTK